MGVSLTLSLLLQFFATKRLHPLQLDQSYFLLPHRPYDMVEENIPEGYLRR